MDVKHNHRHLVRAINELSIQLMVSTEVYLPLSIYSPQMFIIYLTGILRVKCGNGIGINIDMMLARRFSIFGWDERE